MEAVRIFNDNDIVPIAFNTEAEGTYLYQNLVPVVGGSRIPNPRSQRTGK